MVDSTPKFNLTVNANNIEKDAKELMKKVRASWNSDDIEIKSYTEGLTNAIFGCYEKSNPKDIVLMRLYGEKTELLIDRNMEIKNMQFLHSEGCAGQLYAIFNNGLAYEFMPGIAIDAEMVRDLKISSLVAKAVAKQHAIQLPKNTTLEPVLFKTIRKFISLMPTGFDDPDKNNKLHKEIPSKGELESELNELERKLVSLHSPIVFCHNDILCKNIIYDEEREHASLIDYEYAGYNFQAFDIGNHFCEWAGIDEVDYSLYPDRDLQIPWIYDYLNYLSKFTDNHPVTEKDIEKLYVQVNKFALAAHYMWGTWALVQSRISTINFDFLNYAKIRLDEYFKRRDEFLALTYS